MNKTPTSGYMTWSQAIFKLVLNVGTLDYNLWVAKEIRKTVATIPK